MITINNIDDWRYYAKCAGDDPHKYELENRKLTDNDKQERARELCRGCLVIKECAIEALHPPAVGTVRAGVWINAYSRKHQHRLEPARTMLKLIATGKINADQIHEANQVKLSE